MDYKNPGFRGIEFIFQALPVGIERYADDSAYSPVNRGVFDPGEPSNRVLECWRSIALGTDWFYDSLKSEQCTVSTKQAVWSGEVTINAITCDYCGGSIKLRFTIVLQRRRIFQTPPPGAKDLRRLMSDAWTDDKTHFQGICRGECHRQFDCERRSGLEVPVVT